MGAQLNSVYPPLKPAGRRRLPGHVRRDSGLGLEVQEYGRVLRLDFRAYASDPLGGQYAREPEQQTSHAFGLTPTDWRGGARSERERWRREASEHAFHVVHELSPSDPRADHRFFAFCGLTREGRPRLVDSFRSFPGSEWIKTTEARHGKKVWVVTTYTPGPSEEAPAQSRCRWEHPSGEVTCKRWAGRVRARRTIVPGVPGKERWEPDTDDLYPQIDVEVARAEADLGEATARFAADMDTGSAPCYFPAETFERAFGDDLEYLRAGAEIEREHLGRCFEADLLPAVDELTFRVRAGQDGQWVQVFPSECDIWLCGEWGPNHPVCQVRQDREALAGRPMLRGDLTLCICSRGQDWRATPPLTRIIPGST